MLAGCRLLLRPHGLVVATARPWRHNGLLVDLPGQIINAIAAGLQPIERSIALFAAVPDVGYLQPGQSVRQLAVTRQARRNGTPLQGSNRFGLRSPGGA